MLNENEHIQAKTQTPNPIDGRKGTLHRSLVAYARLGVAVAASAIGGCGATVSDGSENESEIISRVELTFSPSDGSDPVIASFTDPDGDGGMSGVADDIELALGTQYTLDIRVLNELVEPTFDITDELRAEAEEHLFFVLGDGVVGPASTSASALVAHAYDDLESDYGDNAVGEDLPVGLSNTITANTAGEAQLRVILRHLPELNGSPQKRPGLPQDLRDGGSLPGDVDVDVGFAVRVL